MYSNLILSVNSNASRGLDSVKKLKFYKDAVLNKVTYFCTFEVKRTHQWTIIVDGNNSMDLRVKRR